MAFLGEGFITWSIMIAVPYFIVFVGFAPLLDNIVDIAPTKQ